MINDLEEKREEISNLERPEQQLNRMREYYAKAERLDNYFSKYRDKGSGGENYWAFLSARGKYFMRYGPYEKEGKVIAAFERNILNPPRKGRHSRWNRDDWAVYEAISRGTLDYSWAGFKSQRW